MTVVSSGEYAQRERMLREANGLGNPIPKPTNAHVSSDMSTSGIKQRANREGYLETSDAVPDADWTPWGRDSRERPALKK